jgi:prophage DNA circulation protein
VDDVLTIVVRLDRRTLQTKIDVLDDAVGAADVALALDRAAESARREGLARLVRARRAPQAPPRPLDETE